MAITTTNIGGQSDKTTAPVHALPVHGAEFVDCDGLRAGFGIKRSLAYELHAQGLIRGVSLRRKGQVRGKRLWDVASVRAYLAAQMEGGQE